MTQTDKTIKKGIVRLGFLMMACDIIGILLYKLCFAQYWIPLFPALVLVMFVVSAIGISVTAKAMERDNATFVNIKMTSTILRLVLYALIFLLYAIFVKTNLVSFFISFAILYVVFSVFETCFTYSLRNSVSSQTKQISK